MKNLKTNLLGMFLFCSSLLSAQQIQTTQSIPLYQQVEDILAPLDKSAVKTQILYDKGMDFYDWSLFGDILPPDSLSIDANDWGWQ